MKVMKAIQNEHLSKITTTRFTVQATQKKGTLATTEHQEAGSRKLERKMDSTT
jgi:hypothetical protein